MWRAIWMFVVSSMLLGWSASASAAQADVEAAQVDFDQQVAAAGNADCAVACRALESLRRAAERLCALDPGERCESARGKLRGAVARVRAACPDCAADTLEAPPSPVTATQPSPVSAESVATKRRGGCAGCASAPSDPGACAAIAVAVATAIAGALRRRRRQTHADA